MSFGWDRDVPAVRDAITEALKKKTRDGHTPLFFASASNDGYRRDSRSFPASENDKVIGVYVVDGHGADTSTLNPPAMSYCNNFATFGHGVPVTWKGKPLHESGTSYATPMLAAIVANYFDWLAPGVNPTPEEKEGYKLARQKTRVEQVLRNKMSQQCGETKLRFVAPWRLCGFRGIDCPAQISQAIRDADARQAATRREEIWLLMATPLTDRAG